MGRNFNTFIKKLEGNFAISDNFHRFTKNKSVSARSYGQKIPNSWIEIHFKTYPRLNKINLLKTKAIGVLERTLLKRRSIRNFSGRAISLKDLSKILFFSAGIINSSSQLNNTKRSYPSAGARYPLELYLIALNMVNVEKGLYHYNVKQHLLEQLLKLDLLDWVVNATGDDRNLGKASFILVITGVLNRTRTKYGNRGYRYILLDAGHLAQNILLMITSLNLAGYPIGGFIDNEFNKLLDIDKRKEVALYLVAVGQNSK